MARLGIISGTIFLQVPGVVDEPEERRLDTDFGSAQVFVTNRVAFIPRHGTSGDRYILPHKINHAANLSALKSFGVEEVIAVNSTGSLKRALTPGTLVVPDDFIMLSPGPTLAGGPHAHITPTLDEGIRRKWLTAGRDCGFEMVDGGVYWQTTGPRFETRAEIRFMAQAADLVGMTLAGEAIVAGELGMAYASLCSIDNYAHGIVDEALSLDDVLVNARRNGEAVVKIVAKYLEGREQ